MVNTLLGGWQTSPNQFFTNVDADMFAEPDAPGRAFEHLDRDAAQSRARRRTPTHSRATRPTGTSDDDFNWLHGKHSFAFGGNFTQTLSVQNSANVVPSVNLGFDTTNDPAAGLFVPANFPGITSATDASFGTARSLYALLTGRVTQINCAGRLDDAAGSTSTAAT